MLHIKQFLTIWKLWEKSKRVENWCHMNWMKDKWKIEKTLVKFCFKDTKENQFSIELSLAMKNWFISRFLNGENHGLIRDIHQHPLQNQIESTRRQCSVFGGIRKVWCIMSFWNLVKLLLLIVRYNKWSIWSMHWSKNDKNRPEDTVFTKLDPSDHHLF